MKNNSGLKTQPIIFIMSLIVTLLLAVAKFRDAYVNSRYASSINFANTLNILFWISIIWLVIYIQNLVFQKWTITKFEKEVIIPFKGDITKQLIAGRDNRNEKIEVLRKELNLEFRLIRLKSRLKVQGIEWDYKEQHKNNKTTVDAAFNEEERLFLERNNFKFTQVG